MKKNTTKAYAYAEPTRRTARMINMMSNALAEAIDSHTLFSLTPYLFDNGTVSKPRLVG